MNSNSSPANTLLRRFRTSLLTGLCLLPASLPAATRTVTSLADDGPGTLRAIIAAASDGDIIQFGVTGTIILTSRYIECEKSLTITHDNPATLAIQSAMGGNIGFYGLLSVGSVEFEKVSISGITFRDGVSIMGGAIYGSNVDLTVTNCVFIDNRAVGDQVFLGIGGAIVCYSAVRDRNNLHASSLTVTNCTFSRNSAALHGGAIHVRSDSDLKCTLSLTGSTFTNNTAHEGGAVQCSGMNGSNGSAFIGSCTFTGNSATGGGNGGAVAIVNTDASLAGCTFSGNEATRGGAVFNTGTAGQLTVGHCCLYDNRSTNFGHDVYQGTGITALQNSTFLSITRVGSFTNVRSVYNSGGQMSAGSSLIKGIANFGTFSLGNCIILDGNVESAAGTMSSSGYNLCSRDGGGFLTHPSDQINTDPRFDPRGLRNNGGPTQSIALVGDSPAIDRGFRFGQTQDQRYLTRPVNHTDVPNATGGDGSDIGPVEMSERIQSGNIQVTTLADHDDGVAGVVDCTLREAVAMANTSTLGTSISFAPTLSGTLTLLSTLGPLKITGSTAITGPGARKVEVSGNDLTRLFEFSGTGKECFLSGLTLRNGKAPAAGSGGAIDNFASLTVRDCAFTSNKAIGLPGSQPGVAGVTVQGGAIRNSGTLWLERCSFSGNSAQGGNGAGNSNFGRGGNGGDGLGGAVYNAANASLTAECCTFYNNIGMGGNGGSNSSFAGGNGGMGRGGIYSLGQMTLTSCTLSGNLGAGGLGGDGNNQVNTGVAGSSGGALTSLAGAMVRNSICSANNGGNGPDVSGIFTSGGSNLIGKTNGGSGFTAPADRTGTNAIPLNALLGPFQNNGGQTDSMLPAAGSPALDGGRQFAVEFEQRRVLRRYDDPAITNASGSDGTDIGAVEAGASGPGGFNIVSTDMQTDLVSILVKGPSNSIYRYQLQKSTDLTDSFVDCGAAVQADPSGYIQFIDPAPSRVRDFYRVIQRTEF